MKIVFFCIPAFGHTNPTLGIVKELIKDGHRVWYYSFDMLKETIEKTGATFVACDEYDMQSKLSKKDGERIAKDVAFAVKVLADTTLSLDKKICKDMENIKPDVIVSDSMALWGKLVALKLNIPFVSSTTTFAFNRYSSKIMKKTFAEIIGMIVSMPKINKEIKRLQAVGYPVKSILDIIANDDNTDTIVYTSPEFQPASETFSEKYAFVGPSIRTATEEIEKTKEKLVYVSMGTVNNDMPDFYKKCIDSFKNTDYQVIISTGDLISIDQSGEIPENISVYKTVDQIAVLKKADVFITHAGMNSVNEALYFGVPLVMNPQTSEQKGVAERVRQLGAGVMLKSVKDDTIAVLNNNIYKENAEKIGESFKKCSGIYGAVEKILEKR